MGSLPCFVQKQDIWQESGCFDRFYPMNITNNAAKEWIVLRFGSKKEASPPPENFKTIRGQEHSPP
jgi:hypothetical protein